MKNALFFDDWFGLLRVLISGSCAYVALVLVLRLAGKRTLSKMNAFDFVVTVALGSIMATILLSKDVAVAEGVVAFCLLIGLQFVITWSSVRMVWMRKLVKAEPTLLFFQGQFLDERLVEQRVPRGEVMSAIRSAGHVSTAQVAAVVLETDGSITVMKKSDATPEDHSALQNVSGFPLDDSRANA